MTVEFKAYILSIFIHILKLNTISKGLYLSQLLFRFDIITIPNFLEKKLVNSVWEDCEERITCILGYYP